MKQKNLILLICALFAVVLIAACDSDDNVPIWDTNNEQPGTPTDTSSPGTPTDTSSPGTPGTPTDTGTGTTTPTDTSVPITDTNSNTNPTEEGVYVVVNNDAWFGYAWSGVDEKNIANLTRGTFTGLGGGDKLCASGTVPEDPGWGGVAMIGVNLNQSQEGGNGSELTVAPAGTAVSVTVENTGGSELRIQIQGAAGYPSEAWCSSIGTTSGVKTAAYADFSTECWEGAENPIPYNNTALQAIIIMVPGPGTDEGQRSYNFCVTDISEI